MPPKTIQRSQLGVPNTSASIESLRATLSLIMLIPKGRILALLENKINDDDPAET
jgi:hypothetical protein